VLDAIVDTIDDSGWGILLLDTLVALGAGVLAWALGRIALRLGRRPRLRLLAAGHRVVHRPWIATVVCVALRVTVQHQGTVSLGWRRAVTVALVASLCWLAIAVLGAVERFIALQLPMDARDNRRARSARTQVAVLHRIAVAVVVLLGLAGMLLTFPALRAFGASLLASAGIAGLLVGLAAQALMRNVIAGLQLAFTEALRVDDVVVVEDEWGRVEDISLTYVTVAIWDERRLILPTTYFTTTPFQNWTRTHSRILGSVVLHLDHRTPIPALREEARRIITESPLWDQRDWVVQVVDTTPSTMVVRVLASAWDAPTSWDLRCDVREGLLSWLRDHHPESLPVARVMPDPASGPVAWLPSGADVDPAARATPDVPRNTATGTRKAASGARKAAVGRSSTRPRVPADPAPNTHHEGESPADPGGHHDDGT
jgi:small-conductance mechanosensitive channel